MIVMYNQRMNRTTTNITYRKKIMKKTVKKSNPYEYCCAKKTIRC